MRCLTPLLILLFSIVHVDFASAKPGHSASADSVSSTNSTMLAGNDIGMFISNEGHVAYDDTMSYYDRHGFFYPIDSAFVLMYTGALWLSADINATKRVALVYTNSEFAPGPHDHPPVEDSSIFRVYKIDSESSVDRDEWPSEWGAPTDSAGDPHLTGDVSAWTVFNDGDTSRHNLRGGDTQPLDAEVHLYAYAYGNSSDLDQIVFLDYTIINKSSDDWDNFRATTMADPDLGQAMDDLGGTDSALSFVYVYSFQHDAYFPPGFYPAVGVVMLDSPTSGDGRIAESATVLRNFYSSRNLPMTISILEGRQPDGASFIDPNTGLTTRFPYSGDPRTGEGWIDFGKGDRRILITSMPTNIASGDTAHVTVAFVAAFGESNFEAVDRIFRLAESSHDFHAREDSRLDVAKNVRDGSIQSVSFDPPEQVWFDGADWGGSALGGGIGTAGELWGSCVEPAEKNDVELLFDPSGGQQAHRFIEEDGAYHYVDYVTVPFECRRVSDSVALNVILIDADRDGEWTVPDQPSEPHEFILLTRSEYAPDPSDAYTGLTFPNDALEADLMYAISLRMREGHERHGIREGQRLTISTEPKGDPLPADTVDFGDVIVGLEALAPLSMTSLYDYRKNYTLAVDRSNGFSIGTDEISLGHLGKARIGTSFTPVDTGSVTATLIIKTREFGLPERRIVMASTGRPWPVEGDMHTNGILDLIDVSAYLRYLYWGGMLSSRGVRLDLDGSGDVSLADLIILINRMFPPN